MVGSENERGGGMICKYCGKEIPKGEVWNPDENGNGYHHKCLIDMEFDENEAYMENLKNHSIIIPEGTTREKVFKEVFGIEMMMAGLKNMDWWNEPYKRESEE